MRKSTKIIKLTKREIKNLLNLIGTEWDWNKNWKEYYPLLGKVYGKLRKINFIKGCQIKN